MRRNIFSIVLLFVTFTLIGNSVYAQPMWTFDLLGKQKKPEKFQERKLGSEKMADKKFTIIRHVFQNNYTHYNYYYNANNKINSVIEKAKIAQKDDYTKLLPYYPYTLENTATQKADLDSVILKATAGILLHDLRNDWIDNMYLLMGKAYFLRKDFDTAASTFQFINYNLFPRKKHEDDSHVVGTRDAASGSRISIANKEKRNVLQKVTARPPSRNDALIWTARTLIEQNELGESAGLINTLQQDPNLPKRLQNDLEDVTAYWFYKQNIYDSTAVHLERALSTAETKDDKSRAEFLLAQLYETTHQYDMAETYYNKASKHTTNALLDIYAQLNNAKMMKSTDAKSLDNSIDKLVHMTKKDKFNAYREILFYSAGELALNIPDTNRALMLFGKSLAKNESNIQYKNKTYLKLADIAYSRKEYRAASAFYDSLQLSDSSLKDQLDIINTRKSALAKIVKKIDIIEREDSLQQLAKLSPDERDALIKKKMRKLRKEKGIKDEESNNGTAQITFDSKNEPIDLFGTGNKGEWYFYNASLRSKGFNEFKRKWGNRPNTDNWRRKSASVNTNVQPIVDSDNPSADVDATPSDLKGDKTTARDGKKNKSDNPKNEPTDQPKDISYDGLLADIPLTPEKLHNSITLLSNSIYELGKLYQEQLEDYPEAIATYDESLSRFPDSLYNGDLYLNMYFCYNKLGNTVKAAYYKNLLTTKFNTSRAANILNNPAAAFPEMKNNEGTRSYESIYKLFADGNYEMAVEEKKKADERFGKNYWTPQLLYIESVYYIKKNDDSTAIKLLSEIVNNHSTSALKPKAEKTIELLRLRKGLPVDLNAKNEVDTLKPNQAALAAADSLAALKAPVTDSVKEDETPNPYDFVASNQQNVTIVFENVEAKEVDKALNMLIAIMDERNPELGLTLEKHDIKPGLALITFSTYENAKAAIDYIKKNKSLLLKDLSAIPSKKFYFLIMADDILMTLRENKDISVYRKVIQKQYPGEF